MDAIRAEIEKDRQAWREKHAGELRTDKADLSLNSYREDNTCAGSQILELEQKLRDEEAENYKKEV